VHAGDLIKVFLELALSPTSSIASVNSCLSAIINLIKSSKNTQICNEYLTFVLATYPKVHGLEQ
jgi:hypothetical protein